MHIHQLIAWLESLQWKGLAKYGLGVSAIALLFVLYDRRPRLTLRARKGEW
jgi:hypothetical protein